ncbi:MAG: F0F1 ATP synthase subunit A [Planctomycetota bacterium]|jgi:F-type H+-transporting ATPase subunit a
MIETTPVILAAADDLLSHVLPHKLFDIGSISVSHHDLMLTVSAIVLAWVMLRAAKSIGVSGEGADAYLTKGRLAHVIEVILIFLREDMTRPALGKLTDRYIGYIWTVFFFILTINLLGMVPFGYAAHVVTWIFGADTATAMHMDHWQGTATGRLAVTGTLALCSMFMISFVGLKHGGMHYIAHHAPVPLWPVMKGAQPGMMPVALLLIVLEIMGAFIKPFALCMRLFANMLAGHLVLGALIGLIFIADSDLVRGFIVVPSVLGSLAMSLLELFVAFLQAYIFSFLTVLFIAQGAVHHHEDHDHEHEEFDPHDDLEHLEDFGETVGVE